MAKLDHERDRFAFLRACELDVVVAKPGNVSVGSDGHRMTAQMFIDAANAAAAPLFETGASVGTRIENATRAAYAATRCNTNLGIVLLCAPLAATCETQTNDRHIETFRAALARILDGLDVNDARAAFHAIARVEPGGLGEVAEHDVRNEPTLDLRSAMAIAADRDSVARQYANGYADIFDVGLPRFRHAAHESMERAVLETYLMYLCAWPDSHVLRKHGTAVARAVQREAATFFDSGKATLLGDEASLAAWDVDLKARGINPGTSADLVVATAFVYETVRDIGR
jgi:triphosphoribosyl-dephospho-CoA synthase